MHISMPVGVKALSPANVPGAVLIAGRITGNEEDPPIVSSSLNPPGVTMTRTSEGLYSLTLPGAGALTVIGPFFQVVTDRELLAELVSYTASTRIAVVKIELRDDGTVEDLETDEALCYFAFAI